MPIYDFSIGLGVRLPLNTGAAASPLMLARYVIPNDVVAPLYVFVIAYATTAVVSSSLQLLGITRRTMHGFVILSTLSVPMFYVTRFDWYSMAVGYFVVSALVCITLVLLAGSHSTTHRRESTISAGLLIVCFGLPTAYVSYWHLCFILGVVAAFAGGRSFLREMLRALRKRLFLVPVFLVCITTVLLLIADLRTEQTLQYGLDRNLYESALRPPMAGLNSLKHLVLQVFVGEWRGLLGILSPGSIRTYAAGNVPATVPMVTLLAGLLLLLVRRYGSEAASTLRRQSRFLISLVIGAVAMLWIPIPVESFDVSDRNIFTHLVGISATMILALFARNVNVTVIRKLPRGFRSAGVLVFTAIVLNVALINPASLRETVATRAVAIAPTSLGRLVFRPEWSDPTIDLVSAAATSGRILSLTEAFDAQKYFQTELVGYVTYNDLTARGVASINAYPKIRNQRNIAPGFKFSSSLAPSSLAVSTIDYCPIDQVRFLGTQVLVMSTLQSLHCHDALSDSASADAFVGTRDGVVLRTRVFNSAPVYVVSTVNSGSDRCPILQYECWSSLDWEGTNDAMLKLVFSASRAEDQFLKIVVKGAWEPSKWLVLPLAFDDQLRLYVDGTSSIETADVNGYAAIRVTPNDAGTVIHASIEPDIRMKLYSALPYAWLGAGLVVGVPWLSRGCFGRRCTAKN